MIEPFLIRGLPELFGRVQADETRIDFAVDLASQAEAPALSAYFLGVVTASAAYPPAASPQPWRWSYTVKRVDLGDNSGVGLTSDVPNIADHTHTGVMNLAEWGNTDTVAGGITVAGVPGDFEPDPTHNGAVVRCFLAQSTDEDGPVVVFDRQNNWSGECE